MKKNIKSEKVPNEMQPVFDTIAKLTDELCQRYLNQEYAQLARQATAALCRKRPSPLLRGKTNAWACGIVYALGFVNFLFDKSQNPHMKAEDLCQEFGVSKSNGGTKAKEVRDALDMTQLCPDWCLPSKLADNPVAWFIMVNGMMVDARQVSREIQEIAFQKGIIPYIPADRNEV